MSVAREQYKLLWPLTEEQYKGLLDAVYFKDETEFVVSDNYSETVNLIEGETEVRFDLQKKARQVNCMVAGVPTNFSWRRGPEGADPNDIEEDNFNTIIITSDEAINDVEVNITVW